MPLLPRLRAVAAAGTAAALVAALAACSPTAKVPVQVAGPAVAAVEHADVRADAASDGMRVLDDPRTASLVVLPERSNGALVVFVHGWGQTRATLLARRSSRPVLTALSGAGYTLLIADAHGKAWGDPASTSDYRGLLESAQRRYGLRDVFLVGESMGGLATMQLARQLPQVRAVAAWYPVCDMRTMMRPHYAASIVTAWQGLPQAAVSPVAVSAKPMAVWASPQDTVVPADRNAAVCVAEARAAGAQVSYVRTRGQHGDPSNFDPAAILRLFDAHRSAGA